MASVFCKKCGEEVEIPEGRRSQFITCPQCKSAVPISAQGAPTGSRPVAATTSAPPSRPPVAAQTGVPSAPLAGGEPLPELMKANKRVAGQPCAVCARIINLGEPIHNCPTCQSINHDTCWKQSGGCPACSSSRPSAHASPSRAPSSGGFDDMDGAMAKPGAPGGANMVPCRWCKEPIMRGARKCKHCNEFQRDEDRETNTKAFEENAELSATDWIGVLCCPIIAFIQGIIYSAQGNPKGKKLMAYSAISMAIGALANAGR